MNFWQVVSRFILKQRIFILLVLLAITIFLASKIGDIKFSHTEANLLPKDHPENIKYDRFVEIFGDEGNMIILAIQDPKVFNVTNFNKWNNFSKTLDSFPEVDFTVSLGNVKRLKKDKKNQKFYAESLYEEEPKSDVEVGEIKDELFNNLPFFDNFLYNKSSGTIRTAVYMDIKIVDTKERVDFVFEKLNPAIEEFEEETGLDIRVSGMPYVRTMNAQNIIDEIGSFVGLALLITSLIFFLFFRSYRATFITMTVVSIGVVWAFGLIGWFQYEVSVLMALIPPLIIVIGVPNAIFLINKYQQEVKNHGNQAKSLQRVISKIGNATLMTNLTTASGFATFMFTNSQLLKEFGIMASVNIIAIFVLSLFIIPIIYSFMRKPKVKHLKHLERKWIDAIINWMERMVRHHRVSIYISTVVVIVVSIIGVYMIRVSGSIIEDMAKGEKFSDDIVFFEDEFGGIMPLEILVDTNTKNGVMKLSTLKSMNKLEEEIDEIPELSKPVSILSLVKYSKQTFYNGNPKYYQLPTEQEKNFILAYTKNSDTNADLLKNFVDSTGRYARITTFMRDIGTEKMEQIEERLQNKIDKEFSDKNFNVSLTGKALVFLKGTNYLVKNLVISLSLAILLISLFMAWMFRSYKMIIISLLPNILPLLITAGLMGYLGVPIKPSTILVFSIAFGISVDDTIHFLAKYRQELIAHKWNVRKSVYGALRETGISMFYTSIVLFFGFLVFTISSFGGTKALGGLVSVTLLFAMISNLLLLPSLLLSLESKIANKKTFKKPAIVIIPKEENLNN
jgi:predicted RND superfamily exporter protein